MLTEGRRKFYLEFIVGSYLYSLEFLCDDRVGAFPMNNAECHSKHSCVGAHG
jgi:hypothetical protein